MWQPEAHNNLLISPERIKHKRKKIEGGTGKHLKKEITQQQGTGLIINR